MDTVTLNNRTTASKTKKRRKEPRLEADLRLPLWARRAHPMVTRHLRNFRTITPEYETLLRIYLLQCGLVLLTLVWPFAYSLIIPLIVAAIFLLPAMGFFYIRSIAHIAHDSSDAMAAEVRNSTLPLMRATPYTAFQVVAAKAAAAMWRQIDIIGLGMLATALFSLPLVLLRVVNIMPIDEYPYVAQGAMMVGFGVAILRVLLEPFMIACIGVCVGAAVPYRTTAVAWTLVLAGFYFALINVAQLLAKSPETWILLDVLLPIVAPLLISAGALLAAKWLIERD